MWVGDQDNTWTAWRVQSHKRDDYMTRTRPMCVHYHYVIAVRLVHLRVICSVALTFSRAL